MLKTSLMDRVAHDYQIFRENSKLEYNLDSFIDQKNYDAGAIINQTKIKIEPSEMSEHIKID